MAFIKNTGQDGLCCRLQVLGGRLLNFTRSDNDMYDHMNNSVYSFLSVYMCITCVLYVLTPSQLRLDHQ